MATRGKRFMDDLEIRIKSRKPAADPDLRDKAADRRADLQAGYPKAGMRPGTVDRGNPGLRESSRGATITRNAVSGIDAGNSLDNYVDAIYEGLGRPGVSLPHTELTIPRPSRRKRK